MTLPRDTALPGRAADSGNGREVDWTVDALLAVDDRGIVRLSNGPAEKLFGYRADELLGTPIGDLIRGDVRPGAGPRGVCNDGSEFPLAVSLTSVTTGDGLLTVAIIRGEPQTATDRERTVAHDVNNTLAGITNYACLVAESLERELKERGLSEDVAFATMLEDLSLISEAARSALIEPGVSPARDTTKPGAVEKG